MAASEFFWFEANGAGETISPGYPPVASLDRADFLSVDETSHGQASNYVNHPIRRSSNVGTTTWSFEKWIAMYWDFGSGTNLIELLKFWRSDGVPLSDAALSISFGTAAVASYVTPTDSNSSIATVAVPTSEPALQNVDFDNSPVTELSATGRSAYIVLQLDVPGTVVTPGDIGDCEYTAQYDES